MAGDYTKGNLRVKISDGGFPSLRSLTSKCIHSAEHFSMQHQVWMFFINSNKLCKPNKVGEATFVYVNMHALWRIGQYYLAHIADFTTLH